MFQRVSTTTSIEITSLHPFYIYEWRVSAFTVGEGPYSSISTVITPEDGKLILVLRASVHLPNSPSVKKSIQANTFLLP